ncbi:hypothetical protein BX661DRAFT_181017, partial [Kickxella alabastrina]|uniref:uncharacterized protein n=1 Tax=Kickxella alabastrina TaxID=61397 RepID=UPI0022205D3E
MQDAQRRRPARGSHQGIEQRLQVELGQRQAARLHGAQDVLGQRRVASTRSHAQPGLAVALGHLRAQGLQRAPAGAERLQVQAAAGGVQQRQQRQRAQGPAALLRVAHGLERQRGLVNVRQGLHQRVGGGARRRRAAVLHFAQHRVCVLGLAAARQRTHKLLEEHVEPRVVGRHAGTPHFLADAVDGRRLPRATGRAQRRCVLRREHRRPGLAHLPQYADAGAAVVQLAEAGEQRAKVVRRQCCRCRAGGAFAVELPQLRALCLVV